MGLIFLTLYLFVSIAVLYGARLLWASKRSLNLPLPPGPKPLPLLGNLADLPEAGKREWEHWAKHKDLYGPISSVTVLGTTIIILNSADLAFELMDKRGNKYSSRPDLVFGMQMCGWSHLLSSQQYTARFRAYRQLIHKAIGTPSALLRFSSLQEIEVHRFLLRVLEDPENLAQHIRTEAGAIILKMTYGYTVEPRGRDPLVDIADRALAQFSAATVPGAWMVDTIPVLRYLPDWIPGAGFKSLARQWHRTLMKAAEWPMEFVRTQISNQKSEDCFVADSYNKAGTDMTEEDKYVLKWSAASLYTGGSDTSVSTMRAFFLAMTLYPDVQLKAREEIDRVVGTNRLPNLDDRPNLPYVEAVVKEAFRWHPIAPMGLPHVSAVDDVCAGYLIPKGAIILPNIWSFTHDSAVYPEPMAFKPDRFFDSSNSPDPREYVFGFGRRICPGKLLADSSVWLTVAKSLATFDIRKAVDSKMELEPSGPLFTPGVISHPLPFKAKIEPRSRDHESLIRAVEQHHPWLESSAETLRTLEVGERDLKEPF